MDVGVTLTHFLVLPDYFYIVNKKLGLFSLRDCTGCLTACRGGLYMMNRKRIDTVSPRIAAVLFIALTGWLGANNVAMATPIGPGFDLFHTPAGPTTVTTPVGPISLQGRPIDPSLGDTDTIVERLAGIDPLPVGGQGTIPIQIIDLSLESISPVPIGSSFFDVFVDLAGPQTLGSMTVFHGVANGGTFDADLPVNARLTFTEVGNPSNTFADSFFDVFVTLTPGSWSHTPRPDDAHNATFPAGGFFPGVDPITGGKVLILEVAPSATHGVLPGQIPEPSTLLLLGSGLAGIAVFGRKRLARKV